MNCQRIRVYVAGKVSKNSVFGTHDWRDDFCRELARLSGREVMSLDPTKSGADQNDPMQTFGCDAYMIKSCDVLVVYLSDDISIGGSQEILLAKYFDKPVIGLAPHGGKFNGSDKEYFGKVVKNYRDPFVFTTCDVVCKDVEEVAAALAEFEKIKPKKLDVIDEAMEYYSKHFLAESKHLKEVLPK
jgi:hypothetical protein